jgi:hypothetical protein
VKLVPSVAVIEPVLLVQLLLLLPVVRGQALHTLFILLGEGRDDKDQNKTWGKSIDHPVKLYSRMFSVAFSAEGGILGR